jgi:signal transduction histidine kinase
VQIDQLWIQLLLKNLILNAYNAIPTDRQGLIQITVASDDRAIQIKLTDNGVGIPAENLNRIFEYGYTTASDRRPSLLHGIGLFFCRQIAHEHAGQIDAESTPGQGTTFTLRLPKSNSIDA